MVGDGGTGIILVGGIPAEVIKLNVRLVCKATQRYREKVCKSTRIAQDPCEYCNFLKIEW